MADFVSFALHSDSSFLIKLTFMLPNFLIVGAQKAATTSLHNYLATHPDIYLPAQKETKFFSRDDCYEKGIGYYEAKYFGDSKGEKALGEVEPDYLFHEVAIERIARHLDMNSLRLIFIFRDPAERAFSHYLMTVRRGYEPLDFEEAVAAEASRMQGDYVSRSRYSYVSRGYYMEQVKRFLRYSERRNMLFLLMEDLETEPKRMLKEICEFLEVSADFVPECLGQTFHGGTAPRSRALMERLQSDSIEKKLLRWLLPSEALRRKLRRKVISLNRAGRYKQKLDPVMRSRLCNLYGEQNHQLAEFLGRDLNLWYCEAD